MLPFSGLSNLAGCNRINSESLMTERIAMWRELEEHAILSRECAISGIARWVAT